MDVDKFWGCAGSDDIHEIPNPEGVAALRTRVIEFSGKFEPVKWSCRAPLPNGNLCPRKDRFKVSLKIRFCSNKKIKHSVKLNAVYNFSVLFMEKLYLEMNKVNV